MCGQQRAGPGAARGSMAASRKTPKRSETGWKRWLLYGSLGMVMMAAALLCLVTPWAQLWHWMGLHISSTTFQHTFTASPESGLLPDPASIEVVEESHIYSLNSASVRVLQAGPRGRESRQRSSQSDTGIEAEALSSLNVALALQIKGNHLKAQKLFLHALALCPRHPKVLNHYGEFLEAFQGDVLEADHLYVRALAFSENGSEEYERALQNRKRTQLVVEEIDTGILRRIDDKKRAFQRISSHSSALKRAKKEAYFHHIYHTVGIEGNTMTLSQTRSILETRFAVAGKSIMEHNEVLGLDAALKYINQTLVDRPMGHITMHDILQIHKRVIGYVDPIEAGVFRHTQVYVGDHIPPHPGHIEELMARFVSWLNSDATLSLHPIRMAALAHYKLVYIHPFVDGNGRTSRLLMNLILMQNGYPPVIIRKQDRQFYYQHLVTANDGDIRPFIRFIADCAEKTLDAYLLSTKENSLVPFHSDDADTVISAQDHLDYHDKIVLGGSVES